MSACVEPVTALPLARNPQEAARRRAAPARVRRIAVFRALQLGDMLCAVPALRALRAGEPEARITLIGLPWAQEFVSRFSALVDDLMVFPGAPGMPEQPCAEAAAGPFYAAAHAARFDLAIQLHGSGALTNAVVQRLGARRMAGFCPDPAAARCSRAGVLVPWPQGNEVERLLALMQALGYPCADRSLAFPLRPLDHASWRLLAAEHGLVAGEYVCLHAGARMLSRRWPVERFAEAGRALRRHWKVVLTGSRDEAALVGQLARRLGKPVVNLCGQTALGTLAALIRDARLLLCNDTGASHIAAAVGTPSVVVSCGSDSARWAPLDTTLHRVLADQPPCRPCMHQRCPLAGHPCASNISVASVVEAALALAARERGHG
ncbi:putative heptosyltransferase, Glycosyl transferase, family 9 [Cupriavidus taiwanensis]|uniref:Heptosyltransferase, Glycosyl transferase, family 9 n=2 Tax=Burkholderiaceae TaxID=119060 RepID=A0A375E5R4_9BURK|nr:putative heptosyltransferase, Glycosyl transferase, family 9 [Cupriavidus taiwanensis]SOZ27564.1 putative heptosyltransferase, Glycosyl transferase, family 9 [Cupriavidus taiwanensis]SOZ45891.1 putative heptosyltransferase, Glycosyl transferase, family 9 [Cupriavidus taiwanensis]SOZ60824.1 putative heptosyltransferase, Glycosyl transferase, family 9 [Cupriavidus taiwanensis]SOZ61003.1 putative heptosyltransferase, Glycosyl transferase, family 9 [Cupriavidus taiwanensis]